MKTSEWLKENPTLQNFKRKHPRTYGFFGRRFSGSGRYGRRFTGGIVLSLALFVLFLELTWDVVFAEITAFDSSVMNFIYTFRNLDFAKYFLFFTDLGDWQTIIFLGVVLFALFLMLGKKRKALFFFGTLASSEIFYLLVKLVIARPRPSVFYSLVSRSGFSFPSGHAVGSVVFYGFAAYLLAGMFKKRLPKILIWLLGVFVVLNVGLSRIYLGVHWTSDVLGGWLLGLSIAIFSIFFMKDLARSKPEIEKPVFSKKSIHQITAGFLFLSFLFIYYFYADNPLLYKPLPAPPTPILLDASSSVADMVSRSDFPKFSEAIDGDKMEPMSFIIIGSKGELVSAFKSEGWIIADPPTTANFLRLALAAVEGKQYDAAPASPSFLNAEPELLTFEKDIGGTFKVRHHARFWETQFVYGGEPVWVASASFDQGLQSYLIYHKISPDIDTERDYVNADLLKSGFVRSETEIQSVPPMMGEDFAEDPFFTNGKAYVIFLR